jgi:hypothetical protein
MSRLDRCHALMADNKTPASVAAQLAAMVKNDLFRAVDAHALLIEAYLAAGNFSAADEASRFVVLFFRCV